MATAAQLVQAAVVLAAVAFGFFTSMNQALVAAMAGAGFARGREAVHVQTLVGIVRGWLLGPAGGFAIAYIGAHIAQAVTG
jgi:inorganic phosphate transporter, PiT family